MRSPGGDRRAGIDRPAMLRPAHGAARAATGGGGIPGRGPAGTGRTGPARGRGGRADRRGGRPAAGGRGAGDSTGGGGRGRMAVGNRRGERKPRRGRGFRPVPRPPRPRENICHVPIPYFFPISILPLHPPILANKGRGGGPRLSLG